jgi:magnesium transporter
MSKSLKKSKKRISKKAGLPPGSLVHIGQKYSENEEIELITYSQTKIDGFSNKNWQEIFDNIHTDQTNWLNFEGLHNVKVIEQFGKEFNLHPLLLEDVLNAEHRPSSEDYEGSVFFSLKAVNKIEESLIQYEHISLVLGPYYIISFQEKAGDLFGPIRERLQNSQSKLRGRQADYLFYRLIDTVVDSYYHVLELLGERIEMLEDRVFAKPDNQSLQEIQNLKKDLVHLRKAVYPLREALSKLAKDPGELIKAETDTYFRDVYDHVIHIIETVETYRDLTSGLMDMYMNILSNRMNEVMKVLTIVATIFIPLTFIAGIYGMNFKYMPELAWKWGYPLVWGIMITVAIFMLLYFRKRRWL